MDFNSEQNTEGVVIREKSNSGRGLWYVILAILGLGLLGWLAYSAGWFSPRTDDAVLPVEQNNGSLAGPSGALGQENNAPIDSVTIETSTGFPITQTVVAKGNLANGCLALAAPQQLRDGNIFYITLGMVDTSSDDQVCTQALVPFEERIDLEVNNLPAGVYIVNVNGQEVSFELENNNSLNFAAGSDK